MQKIGVGNYELAYSEIVPEQIQEQDTVLIFLHEALGSIKQWKDFPMKLCAQLSLKGIMYERRGYGNSSPILEKRDENYLHNYALVELPQLIENLQLSSKKIILVGHSDGGTMALLYAIRPSVELAGIVTMAAHVLNEPETIEGIYPAIKAWEAGKLEGLRKYHGDKTDRLFHEWSQTWISDFFTSWDIREEIKGIEVPTLIIQGEDDQYGTVLQVKGIEEACQGISETILIEKCGHSPHLEQKELVINHITNFISKNANL